MFSPLRTDHLGGGQEQELGVLTDPQEEGGSVNMSQEMRKNPPKTPQETRHAPFIRETGS